MKLELNFTIQHMRASSHAPVCFSSRTAKFRAAFLEVDHFVDPSSTTAEILADAWSDCVAIEEPLKWVNAVFSSIRCRIAPLSRTDRQRSSMLTVIDVGEKGLTVGHVGVLRVVVAQNGQVVFETCDHSVRWDDKFLSEELQKLTRGLTDPTEFQLLGSIVTRDLRPRSLELQHEISFVELNPPYRVVVVGSAVHGNRIGSPISRIPQIVRHENPTMPLYEIALRAGDYAPMSWFEESPKLPWWISLQASDLHSQLTLSCVEYQHLVLDVSNTPSV